MNAKYVARCAQLAMLLEVSAHPKPGNVDPDHDHGSTRYEHFLASAVGVYPVLENAGRSDHGVGRLMKEAVEESNKWQKGGNTHFGAFLLLIPLIMAAGKSEGYNEMRRKADEIMKKTTVEDTIELYESFGIARVHVGKVDELDVYDQNSSEKIKKNGLRLYDMMRISSSYDLISEELVDGFKMSFECADLLMKKAGEMEMNDAIVYAYLKMLSERPDTFVEMNFGKEKAIWVSNRASEILDEFNEEALTRFDDELIEDGVNPGSTADIITAALFLALIKGLRF
jgi:triphosphoribosyl-dephospho-CoA synthase